MKRLGKWMIALLVMICLIGCLTACGDKEEDPKAGKTRDGKATVKPTEEPTPTDEPTQEPTPTDEPTLEPTPTPTEVPTPEPTPALSGHAATLESLFGNWYSSDDIAITIRPGEDRSSVEVVCGSWYIDNVGLHQDDTAPSVMKVISSDVDVDARKATFTVSHVAADQDFIFSLSEVSASDFNLQINHGMTRHFEKTERTPRAPEDALSFFTYYHGVWSKGYDFVLIGYEGKNDYFYASFNTYGSEWLPSCKIEKIVPAPKTGHYVLVDMLGYEGPIPTWTFWDLNNKGDLEMTFIRDGRKDVYVKGDTYNSNPEYSVDRPNIFEAAALPYEMANIYLVGYDANALKKDWNGYLTHEIPGESYTFTDSYGYSVTVYFDENGKITEAKTTK